MDSNKSSEISWVSGESLIFTLKKKKKNNQVRKNEAKVDREIELEFGGPKGTGGFMIFSHFLMLYLWICLEYYNGINTAISLLL